MEAKEYCSTICKAKCCYQKSEDEGVVKCQHLTDGNTCGVYEERYKEGSDDVVIIGYFSSIKYKDLKGEPAARPFYCGKITDLIANNHLPEDVKAQCCFANPKLLD